MGPLFHHLLNTSIRNASSNTSWHGCVYHIDTSTVRLVSMSAQLLLWLFVILGNFLVLLTLVLHKSASVAKTPTNQLLLSLSMADLLLGTVVLPAVIHRELLGQVWLWGDIACDVTFTADIFLYHCSIYNLIAVSFDRYKAVTDPLNYRLFGARIMVPRLIVCAWVSAIVATLPHMIIRTIGIIDHQMPPCRCSQIDAHDYTLFLTIYQSVFFFVPLFGLIWLNLIILAKGSAAGKLKTIRVHRGGSVTPTSAANLRIVAHNDQNGIQAPRKNSFSERLQLAARKMSDVRRKGRSNEQKLGTTIVIVIVAFCVCCVPFFALAVVDIVSGCTIKDGCLSMQMFQITMWLGYTNSALNPIIYGAFSANFRLAVSTTLKRLFCCCCK